MDSIFISLKVRVKAVKLIKKKIKMSEKGDNLPWYVSNSMFCEHSL